MIIRLNIGEIKFNSESLKTSCLYEQGNINFVMKQFWERDLKTGMIKEEKLKYELEYNLKSFYTRIIGVGMLINSYKTYPPVDDLTVHNLYF